MPTRDAIIRIHFEDGSKLGLAKLKEAQRALHDIEQTRDRASRGPSFDWSSIDRPAAKGGLAGKVFREDTEVAPRRPSFDAVLGGATGLGRPADVLAPPVTPPTFRETRPPPAGAPQATQAPAPTAAPLNPTGNLPPAPRHTREQLPTQTMGGRDRRESDAVAGLAAAVARFGSAVEQFCQSEEDHRKQFGFGRPANSGTDRRAWGRREANPGPFHDLFGAPSGPNQRVFDVLGRASRPTPTEEAPIVQAPPRPRSRPGIVAHARDAVGTVTGGMTSPMGMLAGGAAAAAIGLIASAIAKAPAFINTMNNSDMTNAQKKNAIVEELPVIGSVAKWFREFGEAMDGTTEALRRNAIVFAELAAHNADKAAAASELNRVRGGFQEVQNRARVMSGATVEAAPRFDRSTLAGSQAYEEAQRLIPLRDQAAAAQRESSVAAANEASARGRVLDIDRRLASLRTDRSRFQAEGNRLDREANSATNPIRHKAAIDRNAGRLKQTNDDIAAAETERLSRLGQLQSAAVGAVTAESNARRANITIMREELAILQERERRIGENAQRFGQMNVVERQRALMAMRVLQERGPENTPRELRETARGAFPEAVGTIERNHGEQTPEYQEARRAGFFGRNTQTLEEVRAQVDRVQADVRVQVVLDETRMAQQIAERVGPIVQRVQASLENRVQALEQGRRGGQRVANNQGP